MSVVRVLSDGVVNQIAAGEVVERPASVVKELVENALDAGATRIEVLLKAGGRDRIRVSDDGCGMDREDALMCLERHATSKIQQAEDLVDIHSLGFRGEAIPSIASISRFLILTCPHDAEAGVRVEVEGGELRSARAAGCSPGTVIDVREIFFNTPARRKFLRTSATELAHCQEALVRQALGRPDVAFRLQHDGRVVFSTEIGDPASRMRDVLGRDAEQLLSVSFSQGAVRGQGFISSLSVHRPAAKALYAYVNGRFVRDGLIRRAIADAYRDRVPRGRHPLIVLQLEVAQGEVDVNVHPAKTEVRFQNPRDVQGLITRGVRDALAQVLPRPPSNQPRYQTPLPSLPLRSPAPPPSAHPDDDPRMVQLVRPLAAVETHEAPMVPVTPSPIVAIPAGELLATEPDETSLPVASMERTPSSTRTLRAIGSYGRRWLLCEGDGELVVVDHVLADTLLSERRLLRDGRGERLLVPGRERLTVAEADRLEEAADGLADLGLELARMSPTEMALRTVPTVLPRLHLDGLLKKLANAPEHGARILAEAQTLPEPPDPHALRSMLATLEEVGLDAVVGRVPTQELVRRR